MPAFAASYRIDIIYQKTDNSYFYNNSQFGVFLRFSDPLVGSNTIHGRTGTFAGINYQYADAELTFNSIYDIPGDGYTGSKPHLLLIII